MARTESIISRLPGFYQSGEWRNNLYRLVDVIGAQVDIAEEDLIRVMRSHWVNTANNEGSKGFNTSEKGDMDKIFALYLEALGGTSLLKQVGRRTGDEGLEDDKIYRDRIKGLINILRDGASTKQGIIAIVAANLGIVGDSKEADAARQTIRIEEFLPELAPSQVFNVPLYQEIEVLNTNNVEIVPQVNIKVTVNLPTPLINPTLVNLETGEFARYEGSMLQSQELIFLTDGTATLGGLPIPLVGRTPKIGPRFTKMRFEAGYGMPEGQFDEDLFDFARFEIPQVSIPGMFDESRFDQSVFTEFNVVEMRFATTHYTPGTFNVRIPWDIPGYSEVLETLSDKPRYQIAYIVEKVKAAGTFSVITYEKYFKEEQPQEDALTIQDFMPLENHVHEEFRFNVASISTPYPSGVEHEHTDSLTLEGVFDWTGFDSLNTFA
jgi:hypothetical protein